jgi:hypothetical protein
VERRGGNAPGVQPGRPSYPSSSAPNQPSNPTQRPAYGQPAQGQIDSQPANQPARGNQPAEAAQPNGEPNFPNRQQPNRQPDQQAPSPAMTIEGGVRPPNPARGTEQLPQGNIVPRQQQPSGLPPAAERPLYNRAVPPPARPNFDQQRDAIQRTDPGRPLGPQQLDNLRESRPAGPPQIREAAPHPAPEPRSAAPPPPPSRGESQPQPQPRSENKR